MIKMICLDLDGTILNNNSKVSKQTREYLKKLKDKGYIITITTGRMYASILSATDGAEFASYIITDAGACIYTDNELIFKSHIDKKIVKKILSYYNEDIRCIEICDRNTIYRYSDETYNDNIVKSTKDINYILNTCGDVTHITIVIKNNNILNSLYDKLTVNIPEISMTLMHDLFSEKSWIDIGNTNCNKYNSISKLASFLNIDNDSIIVFGDGNNDIEMLKKCGKGIAMKNAQDNVKKVADDVTIYDNDHDGVINYLKEHLEGNIL